MSSIVWSYSKDLLHHAALKIHLVVGKFQGNNNFIALLVLKMHLMHNVESMDAIVTAQNMIYKLSFSITFMSINPHIAI